MIASFDVKTFTTALARVIGAAQTRWTVQVLGGVLLETIPGGIRLRCTDMSADASATVEGKIGQRGSVVVSDARGFARALKGLSGMVTLALGDAGILTVSDAAGVGIGFETLPADDFPKSPDERPAVGTIRLSELERPVSRVAHAVSRDDTRPVLTSIHIGRWEGRARVAATDSYRLAVEPLELAPGPQWTDCNIPGRELQAFIKASRVKGHDPLVDVHQSPDGSLTLVAYVDGSGSATCTWAIRSNQGQFPRIDQLRPAALEASFTPLSALELADRLGRMASLEASKGNPVRLELGNCDHPNWARLVDRGADIEVASAELAGEYRGEPMIIGFNARFLSDALESLGSDSVTVGLANPLRPALLENGTAGQWRLLMPIRIGV